MSSYEGVMYQCQCMTDPGHLAPVHHNNSPSSQSIVIEWLLGWAEIIWGHGGTGGSAHHSSDIIFWWDLWKRHGDVRETHAFWISWEWFSPAVPSCYKAKSQPDMNGIVLTGMNGCAAGCCTLLLFFPKSAASACGLRTVVGFTEKQSVLR